MKVRSVILLGGARNNCGEYLIVARAQALFAHYLPNAAVTVLDRTKKFSSHDFDLMEASDLVVLVGGPLIRNNCAERLNLAEAALSGRLSAMDTPFVIMGGGAKPLEPFSTSRLRPTAPTAQLLEKIESAPYYSGTRDIESIVLLRNAGFGNFGLATVLPAIAFFLAASYSFCRMTETDTVRGMSAAAKDAPLGAIVGGNPAQLMRYRDMEHYNRLKSDGRFHGGHHANNPA